MDEAFESALLFAQSAVVVAVTAGNTCSVLLDTYSRHKLHLGSNRQLADAVAVAEHNTDCSWHSKHNHRDS